MKTTSKNLALVAAISTILSFAIISPSMAIEKPINNDTSNTAKQAAVCTRIASLKNNSENEASSKVARMQADFTSRLAKIASDEQSADQKVAAFRLEKKTKFEAQIQTMKSKANLTDAQKTAIDAFKATMETAEIKREQAVDAARATFRIALKEAVTSNQQKLLTAANTYQNTIAAAFATASTNCTADGALITLKNAVKSARENMVKSRESNELGQTIKQLAQTRNTSIKAANDEFKTTANEAVQTLATALGATTKSE